VSAYLEIDNLAVDVNVVYHWKHNAIKSWIKSMKMRVPVLSWRFEPG
jgi:hypothetical protein